MYNKQIKIIAILLVIGLSVGWAFTMLNKTKKPKAVTNIVRGIAVDKESIPKDIRLVSGPWVGSSWNLQNEKWLAQFSDITRKNQIPYINLYIVAGSASADLDLKDCNVNADPKLTLCNSGANYIRENKNTLLNTYKEVAYNIEQNYGSDKEIFIHFEPDFSQYGDNTQNNGGLDRQELSQIMNSWTDIYKSVLPNAHLVMDVSPWTYNLKEWSDSVRNFEYGGLVGARFDPLITGLNNDGSSKKSYKTLSEEIGKKLIINDSHGPGGAWLEYNKDWENLVISQQLYNDGVFAVIQPPTNIDRLIEFAGN